MESQEDHLIILFDLLDVEALLSALLVARWNHRRPQDRENALRLYDQVVAAAGPDFFGAWHRAQNSEGLTGTESEELLTVSQVARMLRLSSERIRQLDTSGKLKADQRTALGRLYLRSTVETYRQNRWTR